jgi:hypothetical protein
MILQKTQSSAVRGITSKLSDRQPVSVERHVELQIVSHRKIAVLVGGSLQRLVRPNVST